MAGLPNTLVTDLSDSLLQADELYSFAQLQTVFATNELRPFRGRLNQANNGQAQASLLIADLVERNLANNGGNALVLFLRALATRYENMQLQSDLLGLADRVQAALDGNGEQEAQPNEAPAEPARPLQPEFSPDALSLLRSAMVQLYGNEPSAKRIAHDAGISTGNVRFGAAVDSWFELTQEAIKQDKLSDLISAAEGEYPRFEPLQLAKAALSDGKDKVEQTPEQQQPSRSRNLRFKDEESGDNTPPTEIKNRYALLIGVAKYTDNRYNPLLHTINDVKALNELLIQSGYTTRLLHSEQQDDALRPTRSNIWGELESLVEKTGPGDLLLVHYGGHGDLRDGIAYLTAHDTRSASLKRTAIKLDDFRTTLEDAAMQARVLFLDACHSGIGRAGSGMDPEFEKHVFLQAEGTATLASCKQNQVAYEYDETGHGAFTYYLLDGLKGAAKQPNKRFITFQDISNYVTDKVKQWCIQTGLDQQPNAKSELVGDPPLIVLEQDDPEPANFSNPFGATLAIKEPEKFIGRTAILRRLQNMLQHSSIALIGDPKIGKSSLLWQLKQQWPGKVIGPIDFHMHDRDEYYAILGEDDALTSQDRRTVRNRLQRENALILIDEFGYAPQQGISLDDMRLLRSICNDNSNLHVVAASRVAPKEILPDLDIGPNDSPWYNFLPPQTLGPLTEMEGRLLLGAPWHREPIHFDPDAILEMQERTQNHPCWLQQIAFHRLELTMQPDYDWLAHYQAVVDTIRHD